MWAMTEAHARSFLDLFAGMAGRAVVISSGDVYRNYGHLQRLESGPPDPVPLREDSPRRASRYPYRGMTNLPFDWADEYDKILVENALCAQNLLPITILRYPAVYGPNDYHRFRPWLSQMTSDIPELKIDEYFGRWRWTHGFSEDVAEAIVLATIKSQAAGRIYNVGEQETPTWAELLAQWGRVSGWNGRIVPVPGAELPDFPARIALMIASDLDHALL